MQKLPFPLFILILVLLYQPVLAKTPEGRIEVKLKSFAGHEGGYGRPQLNSILKLDLQKLGDLKTLEFGDKMQYVPLPGQLKVLDVDWDGKNWDSLRAQATDDHGYSVVTLDLQKIGASNQIRCWVLVESGNRVRGALYSEGTYR